MKVETRATYIADDGKSFETERECLAYEEQQRERETLTTYWVVSSRPDLTEGRGWQERTYLEVYGITYPLQTAVEDWCYRNFGRPMAFVMGVAPMESWRLVKIDRNEFLKPAPASIGDSKYGYKVVYLVMGKDEKGLVEATKEIQ